MLLSASTERCVSCLFTNLKDKERKTTPTSGCIPLFHEETKSLSKHQGAIKTTDNIMKSGTTTDGWITQFIKGSTILHFCVFNIQDIVLVTRQQTFLKVSRTLTCDHSQSAWRCSLTLRQQLVVCVWSLVPLSHPGRGNGQELYLVAVEVENKHLFWTYVEIDTITTMIPMWGSTLLNDTIL